MEQELIQFILQNGIREVITQEEVYGGFRPLTVKYTVDSQVIIETITYANSANDDGWAAELKKEYEIQTEAQYNSIEI